MFFNIAGMVNFFWTLPWASRSNSGSSSASLVICTLLSSDLYFVIWWSVPSHLMICTLLSGDLYFLIWWSILRHLRSVPWQSGSSPTNHTTIDHWFVESLQISAVLQRTPVLVLLWSCILHTFLHNLVLCIALDIKFYGDNLLFYTFFLYFYFYYNYVYRYQKPWITNMSQRKWAEQCCW